MTAPDEPCPDCDALFAPVDGPRHAYLGGSPACWAAYTELLAREYQDPAYFAAHRYSVDAYSVQHPGDQTDRRAAQSVNVHLVALYLLIEEEREGGVATAALKTLATNFKTEFRPLTPPDAYDMTVKDVLAARNAKEHGGLARQWAEAVWRAWVDHHALARELARCAAS